MRKNHKALAPEKTVTVTDFKCSIYEQYFSKQKYLKAHSRIHDEARQRIETCSVCAKKMAQFKLRAHLRVVHRVLQPRPGTIMKERVLSLPGTIMKERVLSLSASDPDRLAKFKALVEPNAAVEDLVPAVGAVAVEEFVQHHQNFMLFDNCKTFLHCRICYRYQ
jgi:hypothetical protein